MQVHRALSIARQRRQRDRGGSAQEAAARPYLRVDVARALLVARGVSSRGGDHALARLSAYTTRKERVARSSAAAVAAVMAAASLTPERTRERMLCRVRASGCCGAGGRGGSTAAAAAGATSARGGQHEGGRDGGRDGVDEHMRVAFERVGAVAQAAGAAARQRRWRRQGAHVAGSKGAADMVWRAHAVCRSLRHCRARGRGSSAKGRRRRRGQRARAAGSAASPCRCSARPRALILRPTGPGCHRW